MTMSLPISSLNDLSHNGVKGMKWGVHKKEQAAPVLTKQFKTGDSVSIYKDPMPPIVKFFSDRFPDSNYAKENHSIASFTLKDKDGKKVGDASFVHRPNHELYLNWVGIAPKHRGKGYASAALKGVVKYAQENDVKKLTLEVPGNAPDARHIYEKLGFKDTGEKAVDYGPLDVWGGLTKMDLNINSVKHAEDDDSAWEEQFANEFAQFLSENVHLEEVAPVADNKSTIGHSGLLLSDIVVSQNERVDELLEHNGVKGMKWGKHLADSRVGRIATAPARQGLKNVQAINSALNKPTPTGASRATDREAHKDATEAARAKMYFGEGAGTRRKLINATVKSKSRDASYRKAYEHHYQNQDMAKAASKARGQRSRTDARQSTAKHARSVHRIVTGGMGNVTLAASVIVGGYALAKKTGADKVVVNAAKVGYTAAKSGAATRAVRDAFKAKGWG